MFKLLIVDDERNIREGLREYVDYAQFGIEVVGAAADGGAALATLRDTPVDIVLTDIRMPGIDGIQLLESIQASRPGVKCVVLSGYDDFTYVRRAMEAGAHTYLLKPVKRQELLQAMRDVTAQIEREAVDRRYRRESMRLMRVNVLGRLLAGDIDEAELENRLEFLGIAVEPNARCRAVVVKWALDGDARPPEGDARLFAAQAACEQWAEPLGGLVCCDSLSNVVLLMPDNDSPLGALRCLLARALGGGVGVVAGRPVRRFALLGESYKSALSALNYIFILGPDRVICAEETAQIGGDARDAAAPDTARVRRLAQARDLPGLKDLADAYFDALRAAPAPNMRFVRAHLVSFAAAAADELPSPPGAPDGIYEVRQRLIRAIAKSEFLADARNVLRSGLDELFRQSEAAPEVSRYTAEVMAIVGGSYADINLSIKTIAGRLRVNAAYLGRTFQRDTGRYFSDYLNEFRICKAKELLLRPDVRVQEVGETVGYVSGSYFAAVFKRLTGMSPSRWRQDAADGYRIPNDGI